MVIKNVFFHGYLEEEIYMEQPPSFVAQEECVLDGKYTNLYDFKLSLDAWFDRSFSLLCRVCPKKLVYSFVYFDDIVITYNDATKIS